MTSLFILHASEDAGCAEMLRADLEIQGYRIWREPRSVQMSNILRPYAIENAILESAVVLLIWSSSATCSVEVARHLPFALDLKKTILPLLLDQTDLPAMLHSYTPSVQQLPCTEIAAQLRQQALLPSPDSADPLITLAQLAASGLLSERKAAVQQANTMLQRDQQRPAVLAILAYLAQDDPMIEVRKPAQEVLDADERRQKTP
jgi:TIR domain-containing protein